MQIEIKKKRQKQIRKIQAKTNDRRVFSRASILLLLGNGKTVTEVASLELMSSAGIKKLFQRYSERGVEGALFDKPRTGRPPILSANDKHRIAAKACTDPPEGYGRWTIGLLTEEIAKDENVPETSRESVRRALHAHQSKPWLEKMWCVPKLNAEYVLRMEDVLDLYERPYDRDHPVVCVDEKSTQLLQDGRPTIPAKVGGAVKKVDGEYRRRGTANIFCGVEPKVGRYFNKVTESRKKSDFAEFLNEISTAYPDANRISLVLDNLNTHNESSLIERYGDELGRKIWSRFDVHYTPKHASWLNQAEIAIGMYSRQSLRGQRVATIQQLDARTQAWNGKINQKKVVIRWKFTTKKARMKFKYTPAKNTS